MTVAPAFTTPLAPDVSQAIAFFNALWPQQRGEVVHFRGVPEPKDSRHPKNLHYALDENFANTVRGFLDWCQLDQRAAFFLPGVVRGSGTGKADVASLPAVLVDFDKGDPDASLLSAEALMGPATIVIESGGKTETGPKLHAYWRLVEPATGDGIGRVCNIREALAKRFDGDPAFKQAAQVIRIPGSIHFKGEPKLVKLRTIRDVSYSLDALARVVGMPASNNSNVVDFFDFSRDRPQQPNDVERALTTPIHEGAVDDMTRFEGAGKAIGHFIRMIREGRYTVEDAWKAACEWNAATLVPPWSEERLRNDFERLLRLDIDAKGPVVPPAAPAIPSAPAEGWSLGDWRSDRFVGPSPERQWLVEGLVPLGTPGVFAAVGDAGKSMLALQLALHITSAPPVPAGPVGAISAPRFFGGPIMGRGAAVILTAEDDAAEVHRRLNSLDPGNTRRANPLFVVPMLSTGGARAVLTEGRDGPAPTAFWSELRTQLLAIPNLRLVVLDPLSSFISGDANDNAFGAALMSMLGELAATSGAAVMLVHHFAKSITPTNLSDARTAIRGAGALVDNGRWSIVLWEADEDDAARVLKTLGRKEEAKQAGVVYFGGLAKGNAPGAKILRTLARGTAGVLEDVTEAIVNSTPRSDQVDDMILAALRKHKSDRPRWAFPIGKSSVEKHITPVLKAARVDVSVRATQLCVERLLERGLIVETETLGKYEPAMD